MDNMDKVKELMDKASDKDCARFSYFLLGYFGSDFTIGVLSGAESIFKPIDTQQDTNYVRKYTDRETI